MRCAACTTPWPRRWRSGIRMPRRRCGSDTSTSSSPTCPPPSPRSNPASPPSWCPCCSRRATTCTSTSPRPSRPRRPARWCSPAPSAPTTGSRRCCCDGSARRGCATDDRIVLAVAGSSDRRAVEDCRDMAARLAAASARDVSVGFLSAAEPRLPDAVAAARSDAAAGGGRVVVANYLLAPGFFDDLARSAGADVDGASAARARRAGAAGARRDRARPLRRGIRDARLSARRPGGPHLIHRRARCRAVLRDGA